MENILTFIGSSCMALFEHCVIHTKETTKQILLYNIQIFQRSKITDKVQPEPRVDQSPFIKKPTSVGGLHYLLPSISLDLCSFFQSPSTTPSCLKCAKMTECNKGARWHRTHQSHQCMTLITRPPVWHNGEKVDMQKTFIIHPTFSNLKHSFILYFSSFL